MSGQQTTGATLRGSMVEGCVSLRIYLAGSRTDEHEAWCGEGDRAGAVSGKLGARDWGGEVGVGRGPRQSRLNLLLAWGT